MACRTELISVGAEELEKFLRKHGTEKMPYEVVWGAILEGMQERLLDSVDEEILWNICDAVYEVYIRMQGPEAYAEWKESL